MGHAPANVFQLCEHLEIAETEFYHHFGSLEKVEESVLVIRWQEVAEKFAQDEQFETYGITEKMLTYALGRGVEYYDKRTIDRIVSEVAKDDFKFCRMVMAIVQSDPFRLRRGKDHAQ